MNDSLAKFIFEQGSRIRNPSLFRLYEALKESEWLSPEQLQDLQTTRAASFLEHAKKNSPYYKGLFEKYGFRPDAYTGPRDLACLPETDKSVLIDHNAAIHSQNSSEPVRLAETSGTSGLSLSFNRGESWDSLNRATMMRSYDWYGVKPWERNGYFWGFNISRKQSAKVRLLDALQNRFRLFDYSPREIEVFATKLSNASFVSGYSSMIYEVAKVINEEGIEVPPLKLVKGTSEMILDVYHRESEQAFGRKVTSEYGAAESGLIAFECPHGNMHINVENLVLELNDKREALVTNLASYSFPIIRYNLGDIVSLTDIVCPCGRAHPVLKDIEGRKGRSVKGLNKKYPALTFYYVFKNIALEQGLLLNYKAVQREVGQADILIEGTRSADIEDKVRQQLDQYFGDDIRFNVQFVDRFDAGHKKRQYFESAID
jgi:phenylacetate-CoA ligase